MRNHTLRLNADFYLPVDGEGIPNSPLKHVVNTSFDFRVAKPITQDFQQGDQVVTKVTISPLSSIKHGKSLVYY